MNCLRVLIISLSLSSCAGQSIESSANEKQALGLTETHQVQAGDSFSEGIVKGMAFGVGQAASYLLLGLLIAL